jgi:hypothetical protein
MDLRGLTQAKLTFKVDTVKELATRDPDSLRAELVEINAAKKLAGRTLHQALAKDWIAQAKELPKLLDALQREVVEGPPLFACTMLLSKLLAVPLSLVLHRFANLVELLCDFHEYLEQVWIELCSACGGYDLATSLVRVRLLVGAS